MIIKLPDGAVHAKKRVGRGAASRTGCTAGRGTKGQKARSGKKLRPGFEGGQMPLYRRVPRRGFSNYPFKQIPVIISLSDIDKKYEAGDVVSLKTLHHKNVVRNTVQCVKLLCNGDITKAITLSVDVFASKDAVDKIKKAGGEIMQNAASVPTKPYEEIHE